MSGQLPPEVNVSLITLVFMAYFNKKKDD